MICIASGGGGEAGGANGDNAGAPVSHGADGGLEMPAEPTVRRGAADGDKMMTTGADRSQDGERGREG